MSRVGLLVLIAVASGLPAQPPVYPAAAMTSNGVRIWDFGHEANADFHVSVHIGTGSRVEEHHKTGLAHLVEHCLFRSTERQSSDTVDRELRERGIKHNGWTSPDATFYWFRGPSEHAEWMIRHLGDMMARPKLDPDEVALEVDIVLDELKSKNPRDARGGGIDQELYGKDDPISRWAGGKYAHVQSMDEDDVREFWKRYYRAENMVVAFRGGGRRDDLLQWVEGAFQDVRTGGTMAPRFSTPTAWTGNRIFRGGERGVLVHGYHVRNRDPRTLAALWVIGSDLTHRLQKEVRTVKGLAYDGGSAAPVTMVNAWRFDVTFTAGSHDPVDDLAKVAARAIERISSMTDEEFISARKDVLRQLDDAPLEKAVGRTWHLMLAGSSPPDPAREVLAITVDDVRQVARDVFRSRNRYLVSNVALSEASLPPWIPILATLLAAFLILDAFYGFRYVRRLAYAPAGFVRGRLAAADRRRNQRRRERELKKAVDSLEDEIQGWYERQEREETP